MQMNNMERYSLKLTSSTFRRVATAQNQFVDQIFNKYSFHRKNYLGFLSLVYRRDAHSIEHEHIPIQKMILQLELELKSSGMERTQTTVWRQFALLQLKKRNVFQSSLSKYTQEWTKVELTTDTPGDYPSFSPALHNSSKMMILSLNGNGVRDVPLLSTNRVQKIIQVREALNGSAGSSIRPDIQSGEKSFPQSYRKGSSTLQHTALIFQEYPYYLETSMDVRELALKRNNVQQLGLTSTQHRAGTEHWTQVRFSSVQRGFGFSNREWQRPFLETTQIRPQGQSLGLFARMVQRMSKFQSKAPFLELQGSKRLGASAGSPMLLDRELIGSRIPERLGGPEAFPAMMDSISLNLLDSGSVGTEGQSVTKLEWARSGTKIQSASVFGVASGARLRNSAEGFHTGIYRTTLHVESTKLKYMFSGLIQWSQGIKRLGLTRNSFQYPLLILGLSRGNQSKSGISRNVHAPIGDSKLNYFQNLFQLLQIVTGQQHKDHQIDGKKYEAQDHIGRVLQNSREFAHGIVLRDHTRLKHSIVFRDNTAFRHSIAFRDRTELKNGIVLQNSMKHENRIVFQNSTLFENSMKHQSSIDEKNSTVLQDHISLENHLVLQEDTTLRGRVEQRARRGSQNGIVLQNNTAFLKNTNTASFQDTVSHKHTFGLSRIAYFQDQLVLEQVQKRREKQIMINTAQSFSRKVWLKWVSQSRRAEQILLEALSQYSRQQLDRPDSLFEIEFHRLFPNSGKPVLLNRDESYRRIESRSFRHIELFRQPEISSFGIDIDQMKQRIKTGFASRTSFQHFQSLFHNTILATRSGTYRTKGKSNVREHVFSKLPQRATLSRILEMNRLDSRIYRLIFNHESKVAEMSKVNRQNYRPFGQTLHISDSWSYDQDSLFHVQGSIARQQDQLLRYDQQPQQQRSRRARESTAVNSLPIQLGMKRQSVALWQRRLFQRLVGIVDVAKRQSGPVLLHQFTGPSWSTGFKLITDSGTQKLGQKTIEMNLKSIATPPFQKEGKFPISSLFTDIHRNIVFKRKQDNQDQENRQGKVRNNRLMNDSITIIQEDYRAVQKHMQEHVQWHESLNIDRRDVNRINSINRISVQRENTHRNEKLFLADNVSIEYAEEQNRRSINELQGAVERLQTKINHTLSSFETNTGHSGNKIKLANIEIDSSDFDLDDLVDKVYRELEKKFEFEQQRRGLN